LHQDDDSIIKHRGELVRVSQGAGDRVEKIEQHEPLEEERAKSVSYQWME
jgi:hypothetical protein